MSHASRESPLLLSPSHLPQCRCSVGPNPKICDSRAAALQDLIPPDLYPQITGSVFTCSSSGFRETRFLHLVSRDPRTQLPGTFRSVSIQNSNSQSCRPLAQPNQFATFCCGVARLSRKLCSTGARYVKPSVKPPSNPAPPSFSVFQPQPLRWKEGRKQKRTIDNYCRAADNPMSRGQRKEGEREGRKALLSRGVPFVGPLGR